MKIKSLFLALSLAASMQANAATINLTTTTANGFTTYNFDHTKLFGIGIDAKVICPESGCKFWGAADLPNSGDATELEFLETLLGTDLGEISLVKDEDPEDVFNLNEKYFMVKFGSKISAWFENLLFPGEITLTVQTGKGAGLSHVSTFDYPISEVPLPGTMGLFGLGLVGLSFIRKRKHA